MTISIACADSGQNDQLTFDILGQPRVALSTGAATLLVEASEHDQAGRACSAMALILQADLADEPYRRTAKFVDTIR
ncbi:MAG: hypothetical protein ABIK28_02510 [Planctomycetota bacterium]